MSIGFIAFIFFLLFFIVRTILNDSKQHSIQPQYKGSGAAVPLNDFDQLVKNLKSQQEKTASAATSEQNHHTESDHSNAHHHIKQETPVTREKQEENSDFDLKSAVIYSSIMDRKNF